jgi:predicted amidophosphoribosyltransferase
MICPNCHRAIPFHHDTLLCPHCQGELGEVLIDGEPVRHCAGVITDPRQMSRAVQQAIAFRRMNERVG